MRSLVLALICLATTSAYATKARMHSLNQDADGSYYLLDTRNVFLNPAQISLLKDNANFEWGRQVRPGVTAPITENEGGFVMAVGPGKLGAQLGRVTSFNNLIREVNGYLSDIPTNVASGGTFVEGQNNLDIMYGGVGSLRWGGGLALTRSKAATGAAGKQSSVQAFDFRGGVQSDRFEAFGSVLLAAKSETDLATTTAKLNEGFGLKAGGGFQITSEIRVYGQLTYDKYSASNSTTFDYDGKRTSIFAGAAYVRSMANNARIFSSLELGWLDEKASDSHNNPEESFKVLMTPVTLGVEADGNSWLRLRASVRQNVLLGNNKTTMGGTINDNDSNENAMNSTAVGAGAGASLNNFNFDLALVQAMANDHGRFEGSLSYVF